MQTGKNLGTNRAENNDRTLKYAVVKPNMVFNWLAPMNVTCWAFFPELRSSWWDMKTLQTRMDIQRLYIQKFDRFNGHFSKLEESMANDGFHAPVSTITGLPRDMFQKNVFPSKTISPELRDKQGLVVTHTFGGSRVMIAQRLGMDIPCFIYDYTGEAEGEVLHNPVEIKAKFNNAYSVSSLASPIVVRAIRHTHLEGNNDSKERDNRHKVIAEIRKELYGT